MLKSAEGVILPLPLH